MALLPHLFVFNEVRLHVHDEEISGIQHLIGRIAVEGRVARDLKAAIPGLTAGTGGLRTVLAIAATLEQIEYRERCRHTRRAGEKLASIHARTPSVLVGL